MKRALQSAMTWQVCTPGYTMTVSGVHNLKHPRIPMVGLQMHSICQVHKVWTTDASPGLSSINPSS